MDERQNNKDGEKADQRRYVTVLFSDISHSTQLGEASDPEDSAHVVRTVKGLAKQIISDYGGTVTQFHGDGILAIFGYPTTKEDDVQRATEAALELHTAVEALELDEYLPDGFELHMHTGIESGLVLIRQGDYLDGTFELVGDAVNTAAGLCSAAKENEIIASAATLRSVTPFFESTELAPLILKGKTNEMPAYQVLRRSTVTSRFEASKLRGLTAFCGREGELDRLGKTLETVRSDGLKVVQIVGDPGMGKTRLVDEFSRTAKTAGCTLQRGRCEPTGSVAPLHPFLQMLRGYFEIEASGTAANIQKKVEQGLAELDERMLVHSDAILNALAVYSPESNTVASSSKSKPSMETPLENWFLAQAKNDPLVLVIDDWQWVDDASRNVLNYLVREAGQSKILIVLLMRDAGPIDRTLGNAEFVELGPIEKEETKQIVDALLPGQQELGISEKLHIKSGGNPLFLEELCQSYHEWKQQEEKAVVGSVVPATLQGLIETRVQRLPQEQIELAHIASVIGNVIPTWLLNRLSAVEGTDLVIRHLAESDLIYDGEIQGTLQFKHGITRETIYATVSLRQRRKLHNRIAEILEELGEGGSLEEHYESLAYHHSAGAGHEKALHYSELAGDKALASSSLDRARQQYEAALGSIKKLPDTSEMRQRWVSISLKWALPCVYGPEKSQLDILQRTVGYALELQDYDGLAHAYYWQGYISHVLGDQPASILFYERALETARKAENNRLAVQIIATLGQSHAAASNYSEAMEYLDQAIDEKREHPTKFRIRVGSSYAMSSKALALGDIGQFEDSHRCSRDAYAQVKGKGHEIESSILNNHGTVSLWQGRWQDAIDLSGQSKVIAEQVSAPYLFACASAIGAYGKWMLNKDETAIQQLRQTITWVEEKGMYLYSSFFYGWISDALVVNENLKEAYQYATLGLKRAMLQDRVGEAMSNRTLARLSDLECGLDLQKSEYYLNQAFLSATARNSPHEHAVTQMLQADILAKKEMNKEAQDLYFNANAAFETMKMQWHVSQIAEKLQG